MSIKSVITIINQDLDIYPRLKVDYNGTIVLFTQVKTGFVIYTDNNNFHIGYNTNQWDESVFKPFIGEIKLSNK